MKKEALQKKRRPTSDGLFVFHSKTRRRKKQRVAAGAASGSDLGSEVPNLGVARALLVILVLHVAAIAAIFIHNRVTEDDPVVLQTALKEGAAAAAMQGKEKLPQLKAGEDFYFVATGDTYERIAKIKGVDERSLRDINENVKLRAGRILRIPTPGTASAAPAVAGGPAEASAPIAGNPTQPEGTIPLTPPISAVVVRRNEPAPVFRAVGADGDPALRNSEPVKVSLPARPGGGAGSSPSASGGGKYTVKTGDTAWAIAQKHKVSADALLKANGISDARKLRIGMTLKIPAN